MAEEQEYRDVSEKAVALKELFETGDMGQEDYIAALKELATQLSLALE